MNREQPSEQHPESPLIYDYPELAQELLGFEAESLLSLDDSRYSERVAIAFEASRPIIAMKEKMAEAATALGIDVTEDMMSQWRPDKAQFEQLYQEARGARVRLQMLEGLRTFVSEEKYLQGLRSTQKEALLATYNFMEFAEPIPEGKGKGGYLDKPTGSGKTGTFSKLAVALKMYEDPADPIQIQVTSPTLAISDQTVGRAERKSERQGFAKFAPKLDVGIIDGRNKGTQASVKVITNASFNIMSANGTLPPCDFRIVDEVHTGLGDNISESLVREGKDITTVGFSATPDYHDEKQTRSILQHEIYRLDLQTAIKRGLLAPVTAELRRVELEIDESTLPEDPKERENAIKLAYMSARLEDAKKDILKTIREGNGVIIRCPAGADTWFATKASEILQSWVTTTHDESDKRRTRLVRAVPLGGTKQTSDEQRLLMGAFNKHEVDAVTYVSLINMGADLPPAKLLVNLSPNQSKVVMVQAVGRVLRLQLDEHGRPIEAKVIDYADPNDTTGKQYTALDALGLKSGQSRIGPEKAPTNTYGSGSATTAEVIAIDAEVFSADKLGTVVMGHDEDVVFAPPVAEIAQTIGNDVDPDAPVFDFDAAAAYFGLTATSMGIHMQKAGFGSDAMLSRNDLDLMALYEEDLQVEDLPPEGYIAIDDVVQAIGYRDKPIRFVIEQRKAGMEITRFRADNIVRHYMRRVDIRLPGDNR